MQETQIQSLRWEDPLEKDMATHSSILAWEIPGTEQPGELQSTGSQRIGYDSMHACIWHHLLKRLFPALNGLSTLTENQLTIRY